MGWVLVYQFYRPTSFVVAHQFALPCSYTSQLRFLSIKLASFYFNLIYTLHFIFINCCDPVLVMAPIHYYSLSTPIRIFRNSSLNILSPPIFDPSTSLFLTKKRICIYIYVDAYKCIHGIRIFQNPALKYT